MRLFAQTTHRWSITSTVRGVCVHAPIQTGAPDPSVGPGKTPLHESSLHSWAPQSGSRHPVETGAEVQGMEAPPRGGGADLEGVRPYSS